ncbi:MAG: 50S ribosomal protein L15 [Eubacteriales bacterium]|nr:50S ribosomal protein L15 [Eubacteriales bacterium]MDD4323274.1 50S ribosomal protein L15 [Eubacteriales bacterium]MDD4540993.1 50S ribosomal protein L15 [Eubacteriales bacterium]
MKQNELRPTEGSRPKAWRKGRGHGSGNGKTAGRGHKGQNARSGGGVRPQFEGGQMPLYRRIPKRGFNNKRFAKQYIVVNVGALEALDNGAVVDAVALAEAGIISLPKVNDGIKILGDGELNKSLTVKAKAFTSSAREKIEQAGGTCEVI